MGCTHSQSITNSREKSTELKKGYASIKINCFKYNHRLNRQKLISWY